jgi:hypothetical protein
MEERAAVELEINELRWFWRNRKHGARHALREDIGAAVLARTPLFFPNPREDSAATHIMIGPDASDRFWTVVLRPTRRAGTWIAVTGWPSRPVEIGKYQEEIALRAIATVVNEPEEEPDDEEED